jgi:hypothetical protein
MDSVCRGSVSKLDFGSRVETKSRTSIRLLVSRSQIEAWDLQCTKSKLNYILMPEFYLQGVDLLGLMTQHFWRDQGCRNACE